MKYITYRRVSTKGQGDSGLGLEAQTRDIELYLSRYAEKNHVVIEEYVDVASGKFGTVRLEFDKAISLARKEGATLLVAKLDRISRDVETIAGLIKKVELKVACMPHADNFQIHLFAALAEQEREFISLRTRAALSAAKIKGVKLGGLRDKTGARNKAKVEKALANAEKLREIITPMKEAGKSTRQIAHALNRSGYTTERGYQYQSSQVSRIIKRLGI